MQFSVSITFLSLLAFSHTLPVPQGDVNPVNIVESTDSPFSVGVAGDANSQNGFDNGDPTAMLPSAGAGTGEPTSMFPRNNGPVDVVSDSVSPLAGNAAGNSNTNTGLLNGVEVNAKRDAQPTNPVDVVSESLSPLGAGVAGNDNENTGTADGNTVTVAPQIDPTVNV